MQLLFDPTPYHPLASTTANPSCAGPSTPTLFLFAEHGCLLSEQIHLYTSKLKNNSLKPSLPLKIHFLFPAERDFLIRKIDSNSGRKFELEKKILGCGAPALLEESGRPRDVKEYLEGIKRSLAEVELESFDYVQELAVRRFCSFYFERERELYFFVFSDDS